MSFHPRHFKKWHPLCLAHAEYILSSILLLFIRRLLSRELSSASPPLPSPALAALLLLPEFPVQRVVAWVFVQSPWLDLSWPLVCLHSCSLKSSAHRGILAWWRAAKYAPLAKGLFWAKGTFKNRAKKGILISPFLPGNRTQNSPAPEEKHSSTGNHIQENLAPTTIV